MDAIEAHRSFKNLENSAAYARRHARPERESSAAAPHIQGIQRRLSAGQRNKIVMAYMAGASSRDVAKRFKIAKGTVIALVRAAGLEPR